VAYRCVAELFRSGLSSSLRAHVAAIPSLVGPASALLDAETAAVEHQRVLGFEVFPFEGVFLDPEGRASGFGADALQQDYREAGFVPRSGCEGPDHVAAELDFIAFLCAWEAAASTAEASAVQDRQREFLDGHLLDWLPALCWALGRQSSPFYAALSRFALELALDHRARLGPPRAPVSPSLWPVEDFLADAATGLREVAAFLLVPRRSGVFLSRGELTRAGRLCGVPTGFGSRLDMLHNLLQSAAELNQLGPLLAEIEGIVEEARRFHAPFPGAWLDRIGSTGRLLARIRATLPGLDSQAPPP
jgi:putative dimethyl sulfoxide reductase chaperone